MYLQICDVYIKLIQPLLFMNCYVYKNKSGKKSIKKLQIKTM